MMWLKILRVKAGLSQTEIAQRVGISQQYYSAIESGKRGQTIPIKTAKRISGVLDFPWIRFYDESAQVQSDEGGDFYANAHTG